MTRENGFPLRCRFCYTLTPCGFGCLCVFTSRGFTGFAVKPKEGHTHFVGNFLKTSLNSPSLIKIELGLKKAINETRSIGIFRHFSLMRLTQSFLKDRLFLKNFLFPEFFLPWSLGTSCSVLTSMAATGARFLVAGVWSTSNCCRLDSCSFKIWVWWDLEISVDSFFNCVRRFWYQISTWNSKCKICTKMPFGFR